MTSISKGRILLTGASRGIGLAIAKHLLDKGANLALLLRSPQDAVSLKTKAPGRVFPIQVDLETDSPHTLEQSVDTAKTLLGGLDALINCAGIIRYTSLGQVSEKELQTQLSVNFLAPFWLSQKTAKVLQEQGKGGAIVQVASTLGIRAAKDTAVYASTKAALLSLTRSMALEFAKDNIRVNAVAPGVIDTEMIQAARPSLENTQKTEFLTSLHPMGRLGKSEEVAQAVLYLLDAPFTTGSVLVIDGGLLVG